MQLNMYPKQIIIFVTHYYHQNLEIKIFVKMQFYINRVLIVFSLVLAIIRNYDFKG